MRLSVGTILRILWRAIVAWWEDNALRLGASVSYYTLFAIAPILVVAIALAGTLFGAEAARGQISAEIRGLVGPDGARAIEDLLRAASREENDRFAATIGTLTLILASCGAFLELQAAFNAIWRVKPDPAGQVKAFLVARLRSFGLVVAVGFLLMVSLAVSAALSALAAWIGYWAPATPFALQTLNVVISLGGTAALFALLFKFLPDVDLKSADVITGAIVTAVLFTIGKQAIGFYLGRSATASAYGAAGSVIVLLLWVYYSSQIVLIGAEFTRLYADRARGVVPPSPFAEVNDEGPSPLGSPVGPRDRNDG
jgi:membrane protein